MSTLPTSPLPPDPHMCSSDEEQTRSPLSLYSEYQRMDIELRSPHAMPASHWHGQVEINVPFDGDVEYLINNEVVQIKQGHITLFSSTHASGQLPKYGYLQFTDAPFPLLAAGSRADQPCYPWNGHQIAGVAAVEHL